MDISLISGIVIGLFAVGTGLLMKGASVSILFSPEAILVIIVGTIAAVINSYPNDELSNVPKLFAVVFRKKRAENPGYIISTVIELAKISRKNGLLSLEKTLSELESDFLRKGLEMVIDGIEADYIRSILEEEIELLEERHRNGAAIFTTAGAASPTLGVLGAVIGLIGALRNSDNPDLLVEAIAAAFVATLYGIFFGYVIWHPFATRLKRKSYTEVLTRRMTLEGILSLQEGLNPKTIEQKLSSMLTPKEKAKFYAQASYEQEKIYYETQGTAS